MSLGTANRTQMAVVQEVTKGVVPTTPVFDTMNYTGEDLNLNIGTIKSNTIRADRQTADLVRTSVDISGGMTSEVQAVAFETLFAALLQGSWSTAVDFSASSIDIVAATRTLTAGASAFANAVAGQWIKIAGMSNAGNNGWHRIESVTSTLIIVLTTGSTGLVDETEASAGTIKGKMLRNGVTAPSFTIEKLFNDVTVPTYFRFAGCEVASAEMNFQTGSILTTQFAFLGRSGEVTETGVAGATYNAASTNSILDSVNSLGEIREDGADSTSSFQSLTLSINNNARGQEAIGTEGYIGIAHGSIDLTGSTTIYFEDKSTFEKYQDGTPFSLSFILSSPEGDMVISVQKAKFSSMNVLATGLNTDVLANAEFTAIIEPGTSSTIQFDVDNVA